MKALLFKTHLPDVVELQFEALVDKSIDQMYFGPNDPRLTPFSVNAEHARELIDDLWSEFLTEDARAAALARFLDRYDDTGNYD